MTIRIDYNGRRFKTIASTPNGEVGGDTLFHYRQAGRTVWGTYEGGGIVAGHLIARLAKDGALDMRYHHVSATGALMTGRCASRLVILPDGRYRLHESWQWTCGDESRGTSTIEEIPR